MMGTQCKNYHLLRFTFICLAIYLNLTNNVQTCQIVYEFGNSNSKLTLNCSIPSFAGSATWNLIGEGQKTSCVPNGFCGITSDGNYSFSSDGYGIYLEIDPYSESEVQKQWRCQYTVTGTNCQVFTPNVPSNQEESVNTIDCNVAIIVGASFGSVIACLLLTFFIILSCWKHKRILYIILVVFIVDMVAIIVCIWAILYGADVKKFRSDNNCHVHGSYPYVITVLIALAKGLGFYLLKTKETKGKPDLPRKQKNQLISKVEGKVGPGDEERGEMPATKDNHFISSDGGKDNQSNEKMVDTIATST